MTRLRIRLNHLALGALFAWCALSTGCVKQTSPSTVSEKVTHQTPEMVPLPFVETGEQARRYELKRIRMRGHVVRAKLGDMVQASAFSAYCTDRLPDARMNTTVTVEGVLFEADTGAKEIAPGIVGQGTAPGTTSWMLKECVLIE